MSDFPSAHLGMNKIRDIMNCSKKLIDGGEGLARKPGNSGLKKIRSEEFLTGMAANGITSMRMLVKVLNQPVIA